MLLALHKSALVPVDRWEFPPASAVCQVENINIPSVVHVAAWGCLHQPTLHGMVSNRAAVQKRHCTLHHRVHPAQYAALFENWVRVCVFVAIRPLKLHLQSHPSEVLIAVNDGRHKTTNPRGRTSSTTATFIAPMHFRERTWYGLPLDRSVCVCVLVRVHFMVCAADVNARANAHLRRALQFSRCEPQARLRSRRKED